MDRRTVLSGMSSAALLAPFMNLHAALAAQSAAPADPHDALSALPDLQMMGSEKVAMILFPGFTALDLVGPHYFFACMMGAQVDLISTEQTGAPVVSDLALAIAPDMVLSQASEAYDLVFVPGGTAGVIAAMQDKPLLDFLRLQAASARYMASVCTGSAILGQAGLLDGKRATSHWAILDTLGQFGATPVAQRVVRDGSVITGAGVSAGLDLALEIVSELRGRDYARVLTLQAEYAPVPPFAGGSIAEADPLIANGLKGMFAGFAEEVRAIAHPLSPQAGV